MAHTNWTDNSLPSTNWTTVSRASTAFTKKNVRPVGLGPSKGLGRDVLGLFPLGSDGWSRVTRT